MRRFSRLTAGRSVVACLDRRRMPFTNTILLLLDLQIAVSLPVAE
jgi:hypothetical protein